MLIMQEKNIKPESWETVEYAGLCSTCNHASECTFHPNPFSQVLQCEEFDDYVPPPRKKNVKTESSATALEDQDDSCRLKGLCFHCQHRETCKFPKPEGGVWYCQEYE